MLVPLRTEEWDVREFVKHTWDWQTLDFTSFVLERTILKRI